MSAVSACTVSELGFCKGLDSSVYVSEQMNRQLVNVVQEFAYRCVATCAEHYHFDAKEAYELLGLAMIKIERKGVSKEKAQPDTAKEKVEKSLFPLPYNGELKEECCYALRQNNGLYTQCTGIRKGDSKFCKSCASAMQKTGAEEPEYGTIQQRMAVDIFEYVDPKGRKPTPYTKVMKKYKINEDQVLAEAEKLGMIVNKKHFEVSEETKRGRPPKGGEKEPKEKGAKGRPKKAKKVVGIDGDEEDLFATLVANAAKEEEIKEVTKVEDEEEKKALAKQKEEERLKEKEAKKKAAEEEKAEKEAKKEAERLAKEAKKKAAEEEKAAKKKAAEEEKAAKKKAAEEEKAAKKNAAKKAKTENSEPEKAETQEEDEEPDVVKKIEFEGKKYLKSKKTGIIYDYNLYVKEGDQVVVGKWNETTNKRR